MKYHPARAFRYGWHVIITPLAFKLRKNGKITCDDHGTKCDAGQECHHAD